VLQVSSQWYNSARRIGEGVIVKVLNLSRPGLKVNDDLDIRITVSAPQSMMLDLGRIRTAVEISLIVPDPFDPTEPLCRHCRYVVAGLERSDVNTLKEIPPNPEEIESKIAELTLIAHKFKRIFDLLNK
jgi:hypothetical protein